MRLFLCFFFIVFLSLTCFTQETYKGLLWEVSGNNTLKKTYLYGTMHVSGKIAYYLGDEFFDGIKSVDAVALESNPIIWLDEIMQSKYADSYLGRFDLASNDYNGFYKDAFKLTIPQNKDFGLTLARNHYLTNWMLYRENSGNANFEEETFLDMFIYQAGSKSNKPVYSLEDFKQTSIFSMLSLVPDIEQKEPSSWYKEITKNKRYYEVLQDAYRDQDLDLLDSLQKEVSSENHLKYMLYDRNVIMANNIDSIVQSGTSLFIGIGAAHLPREKGVINLLRKKGYTVKPILPTITNQSKQSKEALSLKKRILPYNQSFKDDLFSLKLPCKFYETPARKFNRSYFGPELTNGTFYTVSQISHYNYLKGSESSNQIDKIDSLLFENIPGKIISKKAISKNGFNGIEIVNKTKTGDMQQYNIFATPINTFIFKMGGKHDYVTQNGQPFFDNIKLKALDSTWITVRPLKSDFSINLPSYYHIRNNTKTTSLYGKTEIEAYADSTYYLVKKATLYDFEFMEADKFELNRLIDKFAKGLSIDSVYNKTFSIEGKNPSATGQCKTASDKTLAIKVVIDGPSYYLLATVSKKNMPNNRFFDSFTLTPLSYTFEFEKQIDSVLNFEVNSNYLSPSPYKQLVAEAYDKRRSKNDKKDTEYLSDSKTESYFSENREKIVVRYNKFHKYKQYAHVDSLWERKNRYQIKDHSFKLISKKYYRHDSMHIADVYFTDTNTKQSIKRKYILNKGELYTLSTQLQSNTEPSQFISNFFDSFKPIQKQTTTSILAHKPDLFFNAIYGTDSLEKERALKSVEEYIVFKDSDAKRMIEAINNYPFTALHIKAKAQLIEDLGKLNNENILPLLLNSYEKYEDTASYQIAILKALGKIKSKKSSNHFIDLLETDIPLSGNKYSSSSIFESFFDSLSLAKNLYPQLLNYTFVSDYKDEIYRLLAKAIDSNAIKAKTYKRKYRQILNEAKIELKSQISYEQSEKAKANDRQYYYNSYKNSGNTKLVRYASILIPMYKNKEVQKFFTKLNRVEDFEVQTLIACKLVANNIEVQQSLWNKLASDPINKSYLYKQLQKINRLDLYPKSYLKQDEIVQSILYTTNFNFDKDSVILLDKRLVNTTVGNGYVYFFKSKKENEDKWQLDYIGIQPKDVNSITFDNRFDKKGVDIPKDKLIEELIDQQVKEIEIYGHKRADESEDTPYNYYR